MAKKPTLAETKAATQAMGQAQFVNYDLTPEDKVAFKKWAHENLDGVWDMIDAALDSGYHLSTKWDNYNGCYGAFLVCKDPKNPNNGFILTGRGKTAYGAVSGVFYRHLVVFDGQWDTDGFRRSGTDDE